MKQTDDSLGCLIFIIALGVFGLFIFHGPAIVNMILGKCV